MLIEQAFMALPEFLVGAPYERYEHEGTLVMAFSMSLLQELNGRNVNNPISLVRGEAAYEKDSGKRADLHLTFDSLNIETDDLRTYGYREAAWIEAKFCRRHLTGPKAGNQKINGTDAVTEMLGDIIRLACLPPETPDEKATQGRYLLHAYQGVVKDFLSLSESKVKRYWTEDFVKAGTVDMDDFRTAHEGKTFEKKVGAGLKGIKIKVNATNFVHAPAPVTNSTYTIVLTRFNRVEVDWTIVPTPAPVEGEGANAAPAQQPPAAQPVPAPATRYTFVVEQGAVTEAPAGSFKAIRNEVLARLK